MNKPNKLLSFFAKPPFVAGHIRRVSSILRGEQIAAHMQNARLNPTSGYENDICIYVKPHVKPGHDFNFEGRPYLDMVDGWGLQHLLDKHPEVPAIVFSDIDVQTMSGLVKNKIVCIPHQHINFERDYGSMGRDGIRNVGIIGSPVAFQMVPDEIRHGLANRNIQLVENSNMFPRMSVVGFYKRMDVMLVWRPYNEYRPGLYNPFKIVNASAFGIPSIALDEPAFKEMEGCYLPVKTVDEFFKKLDALRSSPSLYGDMSKICLEKSERYHIDNICKLYNEL